MSRYRLYPTAEQEQVLLAYCAHARFVWNLAVEQQSWWRPGRRPAPGFAQQCRQLTEARRENPWMREIPTVVGQQALRDFSQAMTNFFGGTHRKPTWRKAGRSEGFRVTNGHGIRVEQVSRRWSRAWIPGLGRVRFRRSRPVPDAKSFRVTCDPAGRWHIAFAAVPPAISGPGTGEVVGIDRGVAVTLALSDGTMLRAPEPPSVRQAAKALSRCKRGSARRGKARARLAALRVREGDRRKDWAEKASTTVARSYDVIRIEDLRVANMVRSARGTVEKPGRNVRQKAGLNRAILNGAWSQFAARLEQKAPGRVEKVNPAYTSQTCSQCKTRDREARESQAVFRCRSCGYCGNADVNAARNIAAGHAERGAGKSPVLKREPRNALVASWNPPPSGGGGCQDDRTWRIRLEEAL